MKRVGAAKRRAAAYHEAGHSVARVLACGLPAGAVRIHARGGSGSTRGTGRPLILRGRSGVSGFPVYALAGVFAEARAMRVRPGLALFIGGRADMEAAAHAVDWLVERGYATSKHDAWNQAERLTRRFVRANWRAIERVARALLERRSLTARQIAGLLSIQLDAGRR